MLVLYLTNPAKRAINKKNIALTEMKAQTIIRYIENLQYKDGTKVINSRRQTGFIGMIIGLKNVIKIYKNYFFSFDSNSYLCTYKLSQDHLEIFLAVLGVGEDIIIIQVVELLPVPSSSCLFMQT